MRSRLEDLEDLFEPEELLHARPIPQDGIERGEKNAAVRSRTQPTRDRRALEIGWADVTVDALPVVGGERTGEDQAVLDETHERRVPTMRSPQSPSLHERAFPRPAVSIQRLEEQAS